MYLRSIIPRLWIALTVLVTGIATASASAGPLILHMAVTGSDAWSGRTARPGRGDGPLATLDGVRARLRTLKASGAIPQDGVTVWIHAGVYRLTTPFSLTAQDDLSPAPVTYAAFQHDAVTLEGGQTVTGWQPVTGTTILARLDPAARGHVLQAALKAQDITDYGSLMRRGFGQPVRPGAMELFFDGRPMTLARWPNDDQFATISGTAADQGPDHFTYDGDRPARWTHAEDAWVHGYWSFDWADSYEKIQSIDTVHHQIHTAPTGGLMAYAPKHRWYALNLLEELDEPGEYYLNRGTGRLYFWPPSDIVKGRAVVSLAGDLITLDGVSGVTFRGLTVADCRGTAIMIRGGAHDRITDCTIRNTGNDAVDIRDGTDNGIQGCEISGAGDGGVMLSAGDRQTLTPGRCFVTDCRIHDYSRWDRTYHPAVGVDGVGNRVDHNLLFDAPHNAILLSGNDHLIEYNEIHHVCLQTGDSGAFYMGRDWTMRGNIVRFNAFHDLGGGTGLTGTTDVVGVYLDDTAAGTTVFGNVFVRAGLGVEVGGGRDDIVSDNVFVDCAQAIRLDARGLGWAAKSLLPGGDWGMQEKLAAVPSDRPPYTTRYPHLVGLLQDDPAAPKYDVVQDNVALHCPKGFDIEDKARPGVTVEGNVTDPAGDVKADASTASWLQRARRELPALKTVSLSQVGPRP
jgi:hypothetical protein